MQQTTKTRPNYAPEPISNTKPETHGSGEPEVFRWGDTPTGLFSSGFHFQVIP